MSLSSTVEWDVRSTGNDTNGGGFNTSATGTDYSQQDSAQVTYTDLVIGATNTQLTSAANPFTSAHVGNLVNVTGGTGFTTGRYQVSSVSGSIATMDRAVGTASSTGGAGKLGGALANFATAVNLMNVSTTQASGIVHVKAGTYTYSSTINLTSGTQGPYWVIGYQNTHKDGGTKPLITTSTSSLDLLDVAGLAPSLGQANFVNLSFSHTGSTRGYGAHSSNSGVNNSDVVFVDCLFDGFAYAINGDNVKYWAFNSVTLVRTEVKNSVSGGVINNGTIRSFGSYLHGNGGYGLQNNKGGGSVHLFHNVFDSNTGPGVIVSGGTGADLIALGNDFTNNTSDGIQNASTLAANGFLFGNNIVYGNGGYGANFQSDVAKQSYKVFNNAYGGNTTAPRNNVPVGSGDVTLTASPLTSSSDFALNSAAGGGVLCKGAGSPGVFPGGVATGYLDIGAVQSQGASGGSSGSTGNYGFVA